MHVLVISQIFPPDLGGGATRAYNLAKGLTLNGVTVTVICGFPHYPSGHVPKHMRKKPLVTEYLEGIKIYRTFVPPLPAKGLINRVLLFLSFLISSIFPLVFIRKIDAIFAANPNVLSIFPSLLYKAVYRCALVLNVDDLWPEEVEPEITESKILRKIGEMLAKIAYTMADAITPISPGFIKVICEKYRINPRKINIIRAGVDLSKFKLSRFKHSSKRKTFKILYSGAFSIAYDFNQVLLAAKMLEEFDDIEFILQGGGELADYLKYRVKSLGLKNVKVIDKVISRDEVAELLSDADVLILPLRDFGQPYLGLSSKLYEYQAAGKPIICCANGVPSHYVVETKSGITIKPGDYKALARAVLYLKNNPRVAKQMGSNGKRFVERYASIESIGQKVREILKTLLS